LNRGRAFYSNLSFRQALFSKIFFSTQPLAPTFKPSSDQRDGAFYSVQIRCQAPRRSFVSSPFRDRTAAANNLPERFTTPGRESVNP
ncbi:hypothetical protein, partial [Pseudomonas aeruginosa]